MKESMRSSPRLEDIPELIHRIQLLLPVEEAARTGILSKSWLHAWSTIPTLRFSVTKEKKREHLKMVDRTLIRYLCDNIPIESFDLKIDIENQELASLAEKWIRPVAIKICLTELSLEIMVTNDSFMLPDEIPSGKNLNKLRISCSPKIHFVSMTSCPVINCVSLRELDLDRVHISQEVLDHVFSTCTLLEIIKLTHCNDFKTIKVKNLCSLYKLLIVSYEMNTTSVLEINHVPKLRFFSNDIRFVALSENTLPFNNVTQLGLGGDQIMDDGFLDMIKTIFPFLKMLILDMEFWSLQRFDMTSASLRRLTLRSCPSTLHDVQVNAQKLDYFCFEGKTIPNFVFPAALVKKFKLVLSPRNLLHATNFFLKMTQALTLAMNCDIVITLTKNNAVILPPLEINLDLLRRRVPFPAMNVQQLSFETDGYKGLWKCSRFFDALFLICHPRNVVAKPDRMFKKNNHFCKLMVSEVTEKKKTTKTGGYVHWPCYMKDFEKKN